VTKPAQAAGEWVRWVPAVFFESRMWMVLGRTATSTQSPPLL
jgi:hypothetical protein